MKMGQLDKDSPLGQMPGPDPRARLYSIHQRIFPLYHNHLRLLALCDVTEVTRKDMTYGGSWLKRGGRGAYHATIRKLDRMETMLSAPDVADDIFIAIIKDKDEPDGFIEQVRDFRRYLLLWEAASIELGITVRPVMVDAPSPQSFDRFAQEINRLAEFIRKNDGPWHEGSAVDNAITEIETLRELVRQVALRNGDVRLIMYRAGLARYIPEEARFPGEANYTLRDSDIPPDDTERHNPAPRS
jgi:hypothetical protein